MGVYTNPQKRAPVDFTQNFIQPVLDKCFTEKKNIIHLDDFNIDLFYIMKMTITQEYFKTIIPTDYHPKNNNSVFQNTN